LPGFASSRTNNPTFKVPVVDATGVMFSLLSFVGADA
jgi:hypothetical protein